MLIKTKKEGDKMVAVSLHATVPRLATAYNYGLTLADNHDYCVRRWFGTATIRKVDEHRNVTYWHVERTPPC